MNIDFELETNEIVSALKTADGYLDCENIILQNIKKQFAKKYTAEAIMAFLKKLLQYFEKLIEKDKNIADCSNYRYAAGFLDTLTRSQYWYSWITNSNL